MPADVRLLESRDLFVSQSILSGESLPVEKYDLMASVSGKCSDRLPTPDKNKSLLEMGNICLMGTNVTSGRAQAVVVATGDRTGLAHWQNRSSAPARRPPSIAG